MSQFENYEAISKHYDVTRRAVGLHLIERVVEERCRAANGRPIRLLDIGCGTGNYLKALLATQQHHIGTVVGIDASHGMLAAARAKLTSRAMLPIQLLPVDLLKSERLPFDDEQFDVIVCTQVIHHLSQGEPWQPVASLLHECRRVLARNGGQLVVNWCPREQQNFWFLRYFPAAVLEELLQRSPTRQWMVTRLAALQFDSPLFSVVHDALVKPSAYECYDRVRDKSWRDSDSSWALLEPSALEGTLQAIEADVKSGEIERRLRKCRDSAARHGFSLTVSARRGDV